jgi:excisionase family DNA binding protein
MAIKKAPAHNYLTVAEVSAELRISQNTIRIWLREGVIPGVIISDRGGWRVDRTDLDTFIAERSNATAAA